VAKVDVNPAAYIVFTPESENLPRKKTLMRLLVLEDDTILGPWIEKGLSEVGHVVDLFANGKDALIAATTQNYDVLVLDRMVPGLDGLSVLKALRPAKVRQPLPFF
jgi:two-component system, OmpR family, response regulator